MFLQTTNAWLYQDPDYIRACEQVTEASKLLLDREDGAARSAYNAAIAAKQNLRWELIMRRRSPASA
jgi:hypothetical protein